MLVDLVDPDGVNPQTLVDTMNDLEGDETLAISKVKSIMSRLKKLSDKKLSIIVDTQTLKTGGRPGPPGKQGKKGFPGYQGAPGAEGDRGTTGYQGPTGNPGQPGTRGFRGETGDTGLEVGLTVLQPPPLLIRHPDSLNPCFPQSVPVSSDCPASCPPSCPPKHIACTHIPFLPPRCSLAPALPHLYCQCLVASTLSSPLYPRRFLHPRATRAPLDPLALLVSWVLLDPAALSASLALVELADREARLATRAATGRLACRA